MSIAFVSATVSSLAGLIIAVLVLGAASQVEAAPFYGTQAGGNLAIDCLASSFPRDGSYGNLKTFASVSDSISAVCGSGPNSSTMQASASTNGILRVSGSATGGSLAAAGAYADMVTGITLFAPAGFSGGTVQVTEQLVVSGSASGKYTGNALVAINGTNQQGFFGSCGSSCNTNLDPNFTVSLTANIPVDANGQAYFTLEENIAFGLTPGCLGCTGIIDISHTATAVQILPAGWTFTSDSGDFLAPVPEPDTFSMMAVGLFGIAAFSWRSRNRAIC